MGIQVISFRCVLKNKFDHIISSTFNQNVLAHAEGPRDTLSALVAGLKDLKKGEKRRIVLRADQAYGFYDPGLVVTCPLRRLDSQGTVRIGEQIRYVSQGKSRVMRVTEISGFTVTLDGNHPLAGQDLVFEIEATDAREATSEELANQEEFPTASMPRFH